MTSQLEPSDFVRAAMKAVQENVTTHTKCGAEVTVTSLPLHQMSGPSVAWFCQGCEKNVMRHEAMSVEQAREVLIAYAISAIHRYDEPE
jgi:hypothetical protein